MELLGVRRLVEEQVAAERLVGALAGQNHLDAHGLDLAGEDVHGDCRPHLTPPPPPRVPASAITGRVCY